MSIEDTLSLILREVQALKPVKLDDRLLSAEAAAKLLSVSAPYLYAHAKDFPFTIVLTNGQKNTVRFSYNRLQRWIETKVRLNERS